MAAPLCHIELELAPCATHPFGDAQFTYHLHLPLGVDNRLDLDAVRSDDGDCRVRLCRPGELPRSGVVVLEADGRLAFWFDGRPSNRQLGFRSPPDRFVVGRGLPIYEEDGEARVFHVIAVRHPSSCGTAARLAF